MKNKQKASWNIDSAEEFKRPTKNSYSRPVIDMSALTKLERIEYREWILYYRRRGWKVRFREAWKKGNYASIEGIRHYTPIDKQVVNAMTKEIMNGINQEIINDLTSMVGDRNAQELLTRKLESHIINQTSINPLL